MYPLDVVPLTTKKQEPQQGKNTLSIRGSRRMSVHPFLLSRVVCVHLDYSCWAMNEGFVTMGKWPTYGPGCLHRINLTKTS